MFFSVPPVSYIEILKALHAHGVHYIVGGGVACVLHGVERVTMDVDVSAHMTPENLRAFITCMRSLGLKPRVPLPPEVLLDAGAVAQMVREKHALVFTFIDPDMPFRQVDLFIHPDMAYESLLPDSVVVTVEGTPVQLLGRKRLLEIKRGISPVRLKDLMDIEALSKMEEPR